MKKLKSYFTFILFFTSFLFFAQHAPSPKNKLKISGIIIEKVSKQPLEFATITFNNTSNPKAITGGITNAKGEFSVDVIPGIYDIKVEFISFKSTEIKQKNIHESTNLGFISLQEDASQLNEVVVRSEKTSVEIKLDKKVYNVGKDLLVKGGTVSDVLDNIPSVSVGEEGVISVRGNENIQILIDGRPSNAINISEALKQIPAEAIDKVEVITNPSARYDAEGGGGILNIILKKGKNNGLNGSFITSAGYPESYGASANINYKSNNYNIFSTTGYNYRNNPGNGMTNTRYLNADESTKSYVDETRDLEKTNKGINTNIGLEWSLNPTAIWTNTFNYRNNIGNNTDDIFYNNYDANRNYLYSRSRINNDTNESKNIELATNFIKKFNDKGHKLTFDGSYSNNDESANSIIKDTLINSATPIEIDKTYTVQDQSKTQIQSDYVLPFGEANQFEAGYKGEFTKLTNDYSVSDIDSNGNAIVNPKLSNILEYKEKINALYTQYGFKKYKFSYLFGLRFENSNIDVNQLSTADFTNKKYNNLFPSVFITYEISDKSSVSANYSRRISRPRGRFMNPFVNYSSNINIFKGNPDLDPAKADKYDFGYIKRWDKLTFNTSMYYEYSTDVFAFVRLETGEFVNGIPVILSTPINLADEHKFGFEFNLNYSPYKWWKINANFNLFQSKTTGDYTYTNSSDQIISQNFDSETFSWFTRINSRITLPYKIEWQASVNYTAPQTTAQGKFLGLFVANTAFSKDVLKDKGTLSVNVSDIFNTRKRRMETYIPGVINSYGEMQMRQRQITFSFTYRFNKLKNEKEKQPKNDPNEGGDFQG